VQANPALVLTEARKQRALQRGDQLRAVNINSNASFAGEVQSILVK
jgi:hypothetical protein